MENHKTVLLRFLLVCGLTTSLAFLPPRPAEAGGFLVWDELSWLQDLLNFIKDSATQINQWRTEMETLQHDLLEATGINDIYRIKQQIDEIRWQANGVYYQLVGLSNGNNFNRLFDVYYWENYHAPPDPDQRRSALQHLLKGEDIHALDELWGPYDRAMEREKAMTEHRVQMMDQAKRRIEEINDLANRALGSTEQTEKETLQIANAQKQVQLEQGEHMAELLDTMLSTQREAERRDAERMRIAFDERERKRKETLALPPSNYWGTVK